MSLKFGYIGNPINYILSNPQIKHGFLERRSNLLFSWGMQKEKVDSMNITDATHLIKCVKSEWVKFEGNVELLHWVHVNLAKHISFFITKDGNHVEDLFVNIPIQ